jgi:hypothetical protein
MNSACRAAEFDVQPPATAIKMTMNAPFTLLQMPREGRHVMDGMVSLTLSSPV